MEDRHLHCEKRSDGNMDAKCKKESNELKKKSHQLNKEQKHLKEIATPDY
jgi:hypothetical protein